jgi:hypothetical protein
MLKTKEEHERELEQDFKKLEDASKQELKLREKLLKAPLFKSGEELLQDAAANGVSEHLVRYCLQRRQRRQNRKSREDFLAAAARGGGGHFWKTLSSACYMIYLAERRHL